MVIEDYHLLIKLFEEIPGIVVRDADSKEKTKIYLDRNPGLSFVAENESKIIGCVMAGHDGRRGYLQHLLVLPEHRNSGIATNLVNNSINALKKCGILKTHLFVLKDNNIGNDFWKSRDWQFREDVNMFSFTNSDNKNI